MDRILFLLCCTVFLRAFSGISLHDVAWRTIPTQSILPDRTSCMKLRLRGGSTAAVPDDYQRTRELWLSGNANSNPGTPNSNASSDAGSTPRSRQQAQPASQAKFTFQPFKPGSFRKARADGSAGRKEIAPTRPKPFRTAAAAGAAKNQQACTVTLALLSKEKFAVLSQVQHKDVTEACKKQAGRYDPEYKRWTFPMRQYDRVLASFQQLQIGLSRPIKLMPVPDSILHAVRTSAPSSAASTVNSSSEVEQTYGSIPEGLRSKLMPFQREGVRFALGRGGRVLIGDEMGLGKTIQAIAIAAAYLSDWPLLIVCPSSMRVMWSQELCKWLPGLVEPSDINIIFTGKDKIAKKAVTILSYDLFAKFADEIASHAFGVVIADEGHYLKNSQARRTKCIVPVLKESKRAVLLTGTPALARPVEIFNLVHALHPAMFANYYDFVRRYCDAKPGPFGLETGGSSNLEELHLILQERAMIRRLKKEVLDQLPAKRRQRVLLKVEEKELRQITAQLEQLKELEKVANDDSLDAGERMSAEARKKALIMKNYVDTGTAKLPALKEYVADLIDGGAKFLVFAHHRDVLDGLEDAVKGRKAKYIRIDGSTPSSQRQELVTQFQSQQDVRVAVLSVTAAGTGLTLTAAHTVVFAELHWTPGVLLQAEDRVHRIGQQSAVNIHYLLAQGSCDDLIWDSIAHKMRVVGRALDGQTANLGAAKLTVSQSISATTQGNASDAAQSRIVYNMSGGKAPSLSWGGVEGQNSCAGEDTGQRQTDEIETRFPSQGGDKIELLLSHPVVVAAMENPRLERLFEQVMQSSATMTDEELLAAHGDDADVRTLFQTVRGILNGEPKAAVTEGEQCPPPSACEPADPKVDTSHRCVASKTAEPRLRTDLTDPDCEEAEAGLSKKRRINLRGGACPSFEAWPAQALPVGGATQSDAMDVDTRSPGDVQLLLEELQRTKQQLQCYQEAFAGQHMGISQQPPLPCPPDLPIPQMLSGSVTWPANPQGGMSKSRLESLPSLPVTVQVVSGSNSHYMNISPDGDEGRAEERVAQDRKDGAVGRVVRRTQKAGSTMVVEEVANHVVRREKLKSGSSMVVEELPSGTTIDEIDPEEAKLFDPECQVEVEEVDGVQRFKSAKFTVGGSAEMPPHLVNATEVNADMVNSELHQLAKDFPSCAKYLMHEFDNRRLLTDSGHTLGEEKIRRLMTKVASKTSSSDVKLMALYIREKKCGAAGALALGASQVSTELELPENRDSVNALKRCSCPMDRSMKCRCNLNPGGKAGSDLQLSKGSTVSDISELPHYDPTQYSEWKLKTMRRRMGNVTIEPLKIVEAVQQMGGLDCVEGKQSHKGKGWTAVAAAIGIDVEKNRDAGYQLRKVFMAYHHVQKLNSDASESVTDATNRKPDSAGCDKSSSGGGSSYLESESQDSLAQTKRATRRKDRPRENLNAGRVEKKKRGRKPKTRSL